jgi:hypothetical protein
MMTFVMGEVFFTIFNKIRDLYKTFPLFGKNTQFLKSCISETTGCIVLTWGSNCSEFNLV